MDTSPFKKSVFFCVFIMGIFSFSVHAKMCQVQLHGDILIEADNLLIESNNNLFRIDAKGNLFFDVHKVNLNTAQRDSLASYNETLRKDLPYFSESFSKELYMSWVAVDKVVSSALGEKSMLALEINKYHQYLQNRIKASFYTEDRRARLDHQMLSNALQELKMSLPQLIASVSTHSVTDIAALSKGQKNKMIFMSEKMANLQEQLFNEVGMQGRRLQAIQEDVCTRLGLWQIQEKRISDLIPALSQWKTVSMG